ATHDPPLNPGALTAADLLLLAPPIGVLVVPDTDRLGRDLDDEILVADDALTDEPTVRAHVDPPGEGAPFLVGLVGPRVAALADPAATSRARAHPPARRAHLHAVLLGDAEQIVAAGR